MKGKVENKKGGDETLFQHWKEILFAPQEFYNKLNPKEKYRPVTKYFLKVQAIVIGLFLFFFLWMIIMSGTKELAATIGVSSNVLILSMAAILILAFPFILLLSLGMLYVNAGITHLFVLLFGGKEGYFETYKVMAYSISPNIFSMIPFVNWFSGIYAVVLQVIGIKVRQKLGWAKSIATIIIPLAIILSLAFILYLKYVWPLILATGGL